jgi:hypothetical protein
VTAEYRPAFRVLAQMAAEPTPPPNVRGGGPGVRNQRYGVANGTRTHDPQIHNLVL